LGLTGAAVATSIGRGTGVIYQVVQLVRGKGVLKIRRSHLSPDFPLMAQFARQSFLATAQLLINSVSWLALMRIVARFGEDAVAGYTVGIRIIVFTLLPALGLSNAAATLVGQNLGAGHPERAERSAWRAALGNMIFLGTVSIIFFILARPVIGLFTRDASVLRYGVESLRYISLGYVFYAYGMVIMSAFNGAGDSRTPTIINLFGFWGLQIPLAYALAIALGWGPKGVFSAVAIAESVIALVAIYLFRKGRWKLVHV
jgi:putative MATE family efflux protein